MKIQRGFIGRVFGFFFVVWCVVSPLVGQTTFSNPVIPGDFADPTVIRIKDTYFASGTSSEWAPHYPIFESKDLVNWTYVGPAFAEKPGWTKASFWAPELYVLNGKVYLYYTARRASDGVSYIGVAVTDDIRKGFEDRGCLVEWGTEAIDAFVFNDRGQLYISWKAYGLDKRPIELLGSRLSADGLRLEGEPFMLLRDDNRIGLEGQYHFERNGYYYIVYSVRGCCGSGSDYAVAAARSKRFEGPYELHPGNPILHGNDRDVLSCGHGTAVETPQGRLFYLYHAYLRGSGFYNGRQAFIQELGVDAAQWPYFLSGTEACINEPMPAPGIRQWPVSDFSDLFSSRTLSPEWGWNFVYANPTVSLKNGGLLLSGKAQPGNAYGTVLCLRTLRPDYVLQTAIQDQPGICHGLTLYGDQQNLVLWGKENGALVLKQVQKNNPTMLFTKQLEGSVHLKITVQNGCHAVYAWSINQEDWHTVDLPEPTHEVSFLPPWV